MTMIDHCFNHPAKPADKNCLYCGKSYCTDCLLLQGERKSIICTGCLQIFQRKLKRSQARRWIYLSAGIILLVTTIVWTYLVLLHAKNSNDVAAQLMDSCVIGLVLSLVFIINLVRLKQTKKWLVIKPYAKKEPTV